MATERNGPVFYYDWQDQIKDIEDVELQNMLIWAILDYDRYNVKVDLAPYKDKLGVAYGFCKSLLRDFYSDVDAQTEAWEKRAGRPAKYDLGLFIPLFEEGEMNNKEIAEKIGCSEKTVQRRRDEWKVQKARDERIEKERAQGLIPNKYGF